MSGILLMIRKTAREHPERVACSHCGKEISYGRLWEESERAAALLRSQGSSPVIVLGGRENHSVISILACMMAERTYVPVRYDTPLPRINRIASLANASLILSEKPVDVKNAECVCLNKADDLSLAEKSSENARGGDPVYIIFTSGSTGEPKGVPISAENLENFNGWIKTLESLRGLGSARVFGQASFSFDLSVADLFYSLCGGHTLVSAAGDFMSDPRSVIDTLLSCDVAVLTPTFAKMCLLDGSFRESADSRLKCLFFCGERLEPGTVRRIFKAFPSACVINAYGPTEATCAVSAIRITPEMTSSMPVLPVGETGNFASPVFIENGEIVIGGKSVSPGYLNRNNGGFFSRGGENFYRTGDIGKIENGMLFCLGRSDRQIKYKGFRIELDGIERHIGAIPGVVECAVAAKNDEGGEARLIKAFVVTDGTVGVSRIRSALRETVPEYMIPKSITLVDRLPVSENGKTDRKALLSW